MTIKLELTFATAEEAAKALAKLAGTSLSTAAAPAAEVPAAEAAPAKAAPAKAKAAKAKASEPAPAADEEDEEEDEAPAPAPAKKEAATKLTFQDIRDVISKHTEVHGLDASKAILSQLGFVKASAIPEAKYQEVFTKFEDALDA